MDRGGWLSTEGGRLLNNSSFVYGGEYEEAEERLPGVEERLPEVITGFEVVFEKHGRMPLS